MIPYKFFATYDKNITIYGPYESPSECLKAARKWQKDNGDDPRWFALEDDYLTISTKYEGKSHV